MSNSERTEVHEPSPEVQNEMRLHMTLNDLRSLITSNISIEEREVLLESLEPIMAMLGTVSVKTDAQNREENTEDWFLSEKSYEEYFNEEEAS